MRIVLIPLLLFPFLPRAVAQVQETWSTTWGRPDQDEFVRSVLAVPGGDLVIGALGASTPGSPQVAAVERYRNDGTRLWSTTPLLPAEAPLLARSPTDGSIFALSSTSSAGLAKLDSSGAVLWTRSYPGRVGFDGRPALVLDAAGNARFGLTDNATRRATIYAVDPSGTTVSAATVPSTLGLVEEVVSAALLPGGDVVVGMRADELPPGMFPWDPPEPYLARMTAAGSAVWVRTPPHPWSGIGEGAYVSQVVVDPSGAVYAGLRGVGNNGFATLGSWIVKYDGAGNLAWSHSLDASAPSHLADMKTDALGRLVCASTSFSTWTARVTFLESSGVVRWEHASSYYLGALSNLAIDPSGDVWAAGYRQVGLPATAFLTTIARVSPLGVLRFEADFDEGSSAIVRPYDFAVGADGIASMAGMRAYASVWYVDATLRQYTSQSQAFCFGDPISATCPCGNASTTDGQAGCANSSGNAATLVDRGHASLAGDTLALTASGVMPSTVCLLLQGDARTASTPFGDGLLCIGGARRRLGTRSAVLGAISFPGPGEPAISTRALAQGDALATGSSRFYQVVYRDVSPTFCSVSAWNASSAESIVWQL